MSDLAKDVYRNVRTDCCNVLSVPIIAFEILRSRQVVDTDHGEPERVLGRSYRGGRAWWREQRLSYASVLG